MDQAAYTGPRQAEGVIQAYRQDMARLERQEQQNKKALKSSRGAREELAHIVSRSKGAAALAAGGFDSRVLGAIADDNDRCLKHSFFVIDECLDDLEAERRSLSGKKKEAEGEHLKILRRLNEQQGREGRDGEGYAGGPFAGGAHTKEGAGRWHA